jgi:hypothetical protein
MRLQKSNVRTQHVSPDPRALGIGGKIGYPDAVNFPFLCAVNAHVPVPHSLYISPVYACAGIMGAYMNALPQLRLSGPTLFSPILGAVNHMSAAPQGANQHYNVLLMITDGEINDMVRVQADRFSIAA